MKKIFIFLFCLFLVNLSFSEIRKGSLAAFSISKTQNDNEYTVKSYVQDRLTTVFDAIENVGFRHHDDNATSWIDLIGDRDIKNALLFGDDYCIPTKGDVRTDYWHQYSINNDFTIHGVVVNPNPYWGNWTIIGLGRDSGMQNGICLTAVDSNYLVKYRTKYATSDVCSVKTKTINGQQYSIDIVFEYSTKTFIVYVNAIFVGNATIPLESWNLDEKTDLCFGTYFYSVQYIGNFKLHNMMLYSKMLNEKEIQHNYEIDKVRFEL